MIAGLPGYRGALARNGRRARLLLENQALRFAAVALAEAHELGLVVAGITGLA